MGSCKSGSKSENFSSRELINGRLLAQVSKRSGLRSFIWGNLAIFWASFDYEKLKEQDHILSQVQSSEVLSIGLDAIGLWRVIFNLSINNFKWAWLNRIWLFRNRRDLMESVWILTNDKTPLPIATRQIHLTIHQRTLIQMEDSIARVFLSMVTCPWKRGVSKRDSESKIRQKSFSQRLYIKPMKPMISSSKSRNIKATSVW